jgi:hypothetical protein
MMSPQRRSDKPCVKYRKIIADNLSKAGWSWGCVSVVDSQGRTVFVADAHRGDGQHFIVRADEKLTAFVETRIGGSGVRWFAVRPARDCNSSVRENENADRLLERRREGRWERFAEDNALQLGRLSFNWHVLLLRESHRR